MVTRMPRLGGMSCNSCGSVVPVGARFCPTCGSSQGTDDQERRVVTAIFADIVGFTSLAEHLDPEHVKRLVDRCFVQLTRDITSFGGVVDKIVGDEIVALFGAPVAHEDDAERAVRAALRMQESLRAMAVEAETPFQVRIGINTGEVLVGSSASGRDYTAMGDVMNTASRLQTMAEPGQIVVGASTHSATSDAITFEALGLLEAKGRSGHIEAWVACSAIRPPGTRTRRSSEFVGREHELDVLQAQGRLAIDLRQAQLSFLQGDAGMGKTRLAEEMAGRFARSDGAAVYRGRCVPYGEANVWWPVAEVLRQIFDIGIDTSLELASEAIHRTCHEQGEPLSEDATRFTTAALHALGYQTRLRNGNRDRNRAEVTLMLTSLLERELARRPVILLLSDMHWAAEAVWSLVSHVLSQLARTRFIVVLTARRTGEEMRSIEGRFGRLSLELGPLEAAAAKRLVAELDVALSSADVDELIERSGGNPFFLEELSELVGSQGLVVNGDGVRATENRLARIPDTLRGLLAARLDQLDTNARRVLEVASVIGRSGPVSSIGLMLEGMGHEGDVDGGIATLVDGDILSIEGSRFTFVSDLTREVAYGTITKAARAVAHERVARYLEGTNGPEYRNSTAVAIARHFQAAAQLAVELAAGTPQERADIVARAAHWLCEAGWRAMGAGVPSEAEQWFTGAIEFAPTDALPMVYFGRAKARAEQRNVSGTRSDLDLLASLEFDDPSLRAKALVVRGDIDAKAGDYDHSVESLTKAIQQLHGLGDLAAESAALRLLGLTDMGRDDPESARSSLELARRVAAEAGERREEAWALQSLAWFAFQGGRIDEASSFVDAAIEIFTELDDRSGLGWTVGLGAWVAFHSGDWQTAEAMVAEVLPEIRRRGDPWAEALMMILHASMSLWSGHARLALDIARDAQDAAERADDFSLAVQARAIEGRALITRGRVGEGMATLEQSAALAERAGDAETRRIAMVSNCSASARLGDAERALRWAARFEGLSHSSAILGESDLSVAVAMAMIQSGHVEEAEAQIAWAFDGSSSDRVHTHALAVGAAVASALGHFDVAHERAAVVLASEATYLDRLLANLADAAASCAEGEAAQAQLSLAAARDVLAATDDRVSPLLVALVEAIITDGDVDAVLHEIIVTGINPAGWRRCWTMAANKPGATDPGVFAPA